MSPTLNHNQIVIVRSIKPSDLRNGQILVFKYQNTNFIKRVLGLPGDHVEIEDSRITINRSNNFELPSPYPQYYEWKVPKNHVSLLGDNPRNSLDSRKIGFFPMSKILGRVIFRLWPPRYFRQ